MDEEIKRITGMFSKVLRCDVTRNECGTDTWMKGRPCQCSQCQQWLCEYNEQLYKDVEYFKLWGSEGWDAYKEYYKLVNYFLEPRLRLAKERLEDGNTEVALEFIDQALEKINNLGVY